MKKQVETTWHQRLDFASPMRLLIITATIIFIVEALLMIFFILISSFSTGFLMIFDSLLLTLILIPALYITLLHPMALHISERNQTEQELRKTNQLLERLFSVSEFWIAYLDPSLNFLRVDQPFSEAGGHPPEFYIGKNHFEVFPSTENEAIFRQVLESGEPFFANDKPNTYLNLNKHRLPGPAETHWNWYIMPTKSEDQTITGLVLILIDITGQQIAEKALHSANVLLEKTFDSLDEVVLVVKPDTREIITCNQAIERIFGYSIDETIGQNTAFLHLDQSSYAEFGMKLFPALDSQGVFHTNYRMRRKDGSIFFTENAVAEIRDETGQRTAVVSVIRDVTKQRLAEDEILQRNRELVALNAVSERFASTLSISKLWEMVRQWLSVEIEIPGGMIFSLDEEMAQLSLVAAWGFPESVYQTFQTIPETGFHNPAVFKKREALLHQDLREVKLFQLAGLDISRPNWRNYLCIPLIAGDKILGVIDLFALDSSPFSAKQVNYYQIAGRGIAMAINNSHLYEAELTTRQRLQLLSHRLVEIQEKERSNIARELHDEAGQAVTSIKYDLQLLELEARQPGCIKTRLEKLNTTVDSIMDNLHRLAMDLRPASLDRLGLEAGLAQYINSFDTADLKIYFKAVGMKNVRLPQKIEINLYRIVQETLTNVIRHAHASNVDVLLEMRDGKVILVVEDNGIGFQINSTQSEKHIGLMSMQERAEMLGGALEVESFPGKGTTVVVEVPYGDPHPAG